MSYLGKQKMMCETWLWRCCILQLSYLMNLQLNWVHVCVNVETLLLRVCGLKVWLRNFFTSIIWVLSVNYHPWSYYRKSTTAAMLYHFHFARCSHMAGIYSSIPFVCRKSNDKLTQTSSIDTIRQGYVCKDRESCSSWFVMIDCACFCTAEVTRTQ